MKTTGHSHSALRQGILHSWFVPMGFLGRKLRPMVMPTDTVEELDWESRQSGTSRSGTLEVSDDALLSAARTRA